MNTDIETLDLLKEIRAGNDDAFTQLAEKYRTVTESAVSSFLSTAGREEDARTLAEDMRQEARLALYNAAKSYDINRSGNTVTFGLYAKICIRNALISDRRRRERQRRKMKKLEQLESAERIRCERDVESAIMNSVELVMLMQKAEELLSDTEMSVFREIAKGKSAREISHETGRPVKSVHNAIYRIKVKLKRLSK